MIAEALSAMFPRMRSATPEPGDDFWYRPVGSESSAGITIRPDSALAVSAVFGCLRVLRETFGSLPFRVYRRTGERNKAPEPTHPLWKVLHDQPNSWQTSFEWREMGISHIVLRGNFYNRIVDRGDGVELWPLSPDRVTPEQLEDKQVRYVYRAPNGQTRTYQQVEILHIRGMTLNGLVGVSAIEYARNTIGASIAQETHGAALFKNGGLPTFWIGRPAERKFTDEARANFRKGWRKMHGGAENSGNPPILEDGMELHELGLTNRDSQWIEAQGFGANQVCRFLGVPPHLIGILDRATFSNIEQQSLEFVIYTLGPLAVRWEQAVQRDLIDEPTHFSKVVLDGLLRGDLLSRYQAHNIAIQGGWELVNEARELEDRDPIEGGDTPRYPMNMQPAGGGPDQNEQGGQPGKGIPKQRPPEDRPNEEEEPPRRRRKSAEAGFAILLQEAAGRLASAEIRTLEPRAAKAAGNRNTWSSFAAKCYDKHREYCLTTLQPLADAWLELSGVVVNVEQLAAALCSAGDAVFQAEVDIPALLGQWKQTRAGELAAIIKGAFCDETI